MCLALQAFRPMSMLLQLKGLLCLIALGLLMEQSGRYPAPENTNESSTMATKGFMPSNSKALHCQMA